MSKKTIISIFVVIALLAGVGVWRWGSEPLLESKKKVQNEQQKEEFSSNLDYRENIWSENLDNTDRNDLVWYEVPELEIKFQVTADTKEDLKYFVRENKEIQDRSTFFYLESINKFVDTNSNIKRLSIDDYVIRILAKTSEEESRKKNGIGSPWCFKEETVAHIENYVFCSPSVQADVFDSEEQYKQYEKTMKGKKFGIFFNTIKFID